MKENTILLETCTKTITELPTNCIDLVVTSPPYFGCRVYGDESLGREEHPADYIKNLVETLNPLKRVLKETGSFYLNIGDVYFGSKGFSRNKGKFKRKTDQHYASHKIAKQDGKWLQYKQLLMLPQRVAILLQEDGWILRNDIIWEKANPLPAYSKDRRLPCHEHIFHFVKSKRYYFDYPLAKKRGHHRDVVKTSVEPFGAHPASFSEALISPLIETTCPQGGLVYDPFSGSGTTAVVSKKLGRRYLGSEIEESFWKLSMEHLRTGVFSS